MPISKDQARDIAQAFLDVSHALGKYRFENFDDLTKAERQQIEDAEWDLLGASGSFVTKAVGIALADMENDLKAISDATKKGKKAIGTINKVKAVINVATALVTLAGAITSGNPIAIVTAANAALDTIASATK